MAGLNVILFIMKKEPESWTVDQFWAKHDNGIAIWIGNGFLSCRIEKPEYLEFSLFNRIKLYRAVRKLRAELERRKQRGR